MADIPVLEAADKGKPDAKADKADKKADKAADKKADKGKDGAAPKEAAAGGGKKKLIIFIAIGVLVAAGAGVGGWMFLGKKEDPKAAAAEKGKSKSSEKAGKKDAEEEKEPEHKGPALYVALDPPFVVNFEVEQNVRFLQVAAQIMTHDPETAELLKANDPMIRNDMLLLLGNQDSKTVSTREGKEALRAQALEVVRKVVTTAGGKPKRVEAVFFTSFVMQ